MPRAPFAALLALLSPIALVAGDARAATWENVTTTAIGATGEWSNKVELADIDDDGDLDILFANGGDYSSPGALEPLRVFQNDGAAGFEEITTLIFADERFHARAVKVRDVNGDGVADLLVATTYQAQSRLFVGDGSGGFEDRTADLPAGDLSVGDLELGDVDGDGDLDVMLADWGSGSPLTNAGGQPRLWLGDGAGHFADATAERMPELSIGMSWDLELIDFDNDRDLDAAISCKVCSGSVLLANDGYGSFSDVSGSLPQFGNNYEFEAMDLDADGLLDLVTINDGPSVTEHVFRGTGAGFEDVTSDWWPSDANPSADDNVVAFLDVDSDGDADFLIGSLDGDDRVLLNDGNGGLSLGPQDFDDNDSPGTLGLAVGDLDGDGKLDVVQSQGEVASEDLVFLGADLPADVAPPVIFEIAPAPGASVGAEETIVARVSDHHSPVRPTDFQSVELIVSENGAEQTIPMTWYGEYLFRATFVARGGMTVRVCAADASGNQACTEERSIQMMGGEGGAGGGDAETEEGEGCDCRATGSSGNTWGALLLIVALLLRRRSAGGASSGQLF